MKRTLFSCCILLTALAIPLLSGRHLRAESDCEAATASRDGGGDCEAPYTYADTYGECFWEDDDCDRATDESQGGQVAELGSVLVRDDIGPYDETMTDYWYDGESDSYYYYEFSDDATTVDEIADETVEPLSDPLDELFDICETETVEAAIVSDPVVAAEEVVAEEADTYGYDGYCYDYEADNDWAHLEDDADYCDESSVQEVCQENVSKTTETAVDETVDTVVDADVSDAWQDEEYDYYSEYEDYGYDFEEYEYRYGEDSEYAYEASDTVDWDNVVEQSADEPAVTEESINDEPVDAIVEDVWEGEVYSDYEDYEYDDTYDYGYHYWDEMEVEAEVTEADANLPTLVDEPLVDEPAVDEPVADGNRELPRAAVLSLAHTLSRIGSTLQSISEHITEMVGEEVAEQPNSETIER